jgi:hypothetical protein
MYLQKEVRRKTFCLNLFFVGIFKVNDENSRIRIRIHYSETWIRGSGSTPKCFGIFVPVPMAPPIKIRLARQEVSQRQAIDLATSLVIAIAAFMPKNFGIVSSDQGVIFY